MGAYCTGSNYFEIGDLGSKVKVTVTKYPFFLQNYLLTSLLCISALMICLIKMKYGMSLRYTLGRIVFEFHKSQRGYDVIVMSFMFYPNNYLYGISQILLILETSYLDPIHDNITSIK